MKYLILTESEDGTRDLNILSAFTLNELLGEIKRRYEEE